MRAWMTHAGDSGPDDITMSTDDAEDDGADAATQTSPPTRHPHAASIIARAVVRVHGDQRQLVAARKVDSRACDFGGVDTRRSQARAQRDKGAQNKGCG